MRGQRVALDVGDPQARRESGDAEERARLRGAIANGYATLAGAALRLKQSLAVACRLSTLPGGDMRSFDSIPQARVFRKAGRLMAPPLARRSAASVGEHLRVALVYAIGLWPLTCVVLLMCGLLIVAGNAGGP